MSAPSFRYSRVVDLSHKVVPETHPWVGYQARIESIAKEGQGWYVVTQLQLGGHAGTHVEAPLHAVEGAADISEVPVERFFGEAVVLDFTAAPGGGVPIPLDQLQAAAAAAGGVRPGDIVFFRFDWDQRAAGRYPPFPTPEAVRWLVDQGVKLLGIDTGGLEVQGDPSLPNHRILFGAGIPLIECLANLGQLRSSRFLVFAQPVPAQGSDAFPLRVLAFEGEG